MSPANHRRRRRWCVAWLVLGVGVCGATWAGGELVSGGPFTPLFGAKGQAPVDVEAFDLDTYPVTNGEYLEFVRRVEKWRRSKVPPIFSDAGYLGHWSGDLDPGPGGGVGNRSPVTNVSWFAAKAYCASVGRRLPTLEEWEFAARASEDRTDAVDDPAFRERILSWYARPTGETLPPVGSTFRNVYGVFDLHGLVWEWVWDWNSVLVTGESRADVAVDKQLYCAGAAAGATDLSDYAAFLRYAMRASLEARYTVRNVGFRCAADLSPGDTR